MIFSQRIGKTSASKSLQIEGIDVELKNGLWNIYKTHFLESACDKHEQTNKGSNRPIFYSLWHDFFKASFDECHYNYHYAEENIKNFFFTEEWYRVYDLIEFAIQLEGKNNEIYFDVEGLVVNTNEVLEREFAGYRIINSRVAPISNIHEVNEIEKAADNLSNFSSLNICNSHLSASLQMISHKTTPDYRNSIKESISAVEALAKIISGNSKDSLGSAIDKIKGKLKIHGALEKGIKSLYAYTSDSDGIRHALTEEANLDFEDAKFMLISCSAFINYLISKAVKARIDF